VLGACPDKRLLAVPRQFGRPKEGISIGPIKFSRFAELVNARAAMVGYALLMYIGYNTVRHQLMGCPTSCLQVAELSYAPMSPMKVIE
jgi:hypothetical protein